jgi:hypothetical protein
LPPDFVLPYADDWVNHLALTPAELKPDESSRNTLFVIGRLVPGVSPQLAEKFLVSTYGSERTPDFKAMIHPSLIERVGTSGIKERLEIKPVTDIITRPFKTAVRGAWALCALILALCAANLAGIFLARCTWQLREYAMRSALGARFSDLVRMLLLEVAALSALAAIAAAAIAYGAIPAVAEKVPLKSVMFGRPVFSWETVVFLIAATLVIAVVSAVPAIAVIIRHYRKDFSQGQIAVFHNHRIPRILLTGSQAAIAVLLLCLCYMTSRGYLDMFSGSDSNVRVITVCTNAS